MTAPLLHVPDGHSLLWCGWNATLASATEAVAESVSTTAAEDKQDPNNATAIATKAKAVAIASVTTSAAE